VAVLGIVLAGCGQAVKPTTVTATARSRVGTTTTQVATTTTSASTLDVADLERQISYYAGLGAAVGPTTRCPSPAPVGTFFCDVHFPAGGGGPSADIAARVRHEARNTRWELEGAGEPWHVFPSSDAVLSETTTGTLPAPPLSACTWRNLQTAALESSIKLKAPPGTTGTPQPGWPDDLFDCYDQWAIAFNFGPGGNLAFRNQGGGWAVAYIYTDSPYFECGADLNVVPYSVAEQFVYDLRMDPESCTLPTP